tara:strand:+ start:34294 stop:35607 length:1314 start_codon:yes stop_codon:yes gene_type:complete
MKKIIRRLTPKSFIGRSVLVLMSGTAMAQLITAASMPVVTRLYTPELIGVISIYLAFFNFWCSLLSWRYESAMLITIDEQESHHLFRLGVVLTALMALAALPVLGILKSFNIIGFGVLPSWAPAVACMSLLGYGWFMLYRSWLLRLRKVKLISFAAVARSGANAGTRIIAGISGFGLIGLFIAEVLGSWSALSTLRKKTKDLVLESAPAWRTKSIISVGVRYKKYAQFEMPSVMVNQLAIALPVPIVGALYGVQAAGIFGLARLLYAIPNSQIGKAVGDVFQMELGRCVRDGNTSQGRKIFLKLSAALALIGIVPLLLAIFVAPALFPLIFGSDWVMLGVYVAYMAPWMYLALVVSSMSRALSVLEKQEWKLIYDFASLAVIVIVYVVTKHVDGDILLFITMLSVGMTVAYIIYYGLIWVAIKSMEDSRVDVVGRRS